MNCVLLVSLKKRWFDSRHLSSLFRLINLSLPRTRSCSFPFHDPDAPAPVSAYRLVLRDVTVIGAMKCEVLAV